MALTRRQFLKLTGASTVGAVAFVACSVPERELTVQSPVNLPEDIASGLENWYATTCTQCPTPHGIVVRVMSGRAKKIEGNPDFPGTHGKHLAQCEAALQELYHPDRITTPLKRVTGSARGSGEFEPISWDQALDLLASKISEQNDPGSVLLATNPMDSRLGYVTQLFAQGSGVKHVSYEPLDETATLRRAVSAVFGEERIPDFDIDNAKFVLSFGSDFLSTWISPLRYARGFGEFRQGEKAQQNGRGTLVQVDSRFSMTAANADQWVPIKPGTEGALALSLAYVIQRRRMEDVSALEEYTPDSAASITGVSKDTITKLAEDLMTNSPSVVIGGGSASAQTNGSFNLQAIYLLNYLINTPGAKSEEAGVVFNPMPLSYPVGFTRSDELFGDWKTVSDDASQGKIKVIITRGINPVHGLANIDFRGSINRDDVFIASVSSFINDTTQMADLILPEHTSLEQWGDAYLDPGPGHQVIAVQQPVVRPRHDTRGFGDILLTLANSLGGKVAQDLSRDGKWSSFRDVVHEGIVELYNNAKRNTRLGDWDSSSADTFWTSVLQHGGWWDTTDVWVEKANKSNPPAWSDLAKELSSNTPTYAGSNAAGSFNLIPFVSSAIGSGYGANLPWLQGTPDPITSIAWITWIEINSNTASGLGLSEGDIVTVQGVNGSFEAPLYPHPGVPPDVVCIPFGQGHAEYGRYAQGRGANVVAILGDTRSDQNTLAWGSTRVTLSSTGDNRPLPKLEGTQLAVDPHPGHIIKIENGHSTDHH